MFGISTIFWFGMVLTVWKAFQGSQSGHKTVIESLWKIINILGENCWKYICIKWINIFENQVENRIVAVIVISTLSVTLQDVFVQIILIVVKTYFFVKKILILFHFIGVLQLQNLTGVRNQIVTLIFLMTQTSWGLLWYP